MTVAGKGYTVGIASETKAFKQGVDTGIIKPISDAQRKLEDLGRARGPEQLERGMKDAEQATERLGDEVKVTARDIEDEFRSSYRKVKSSSDDAFDGIKRGANEAKDEVQSTAREGAASFSGEWSDVGDVVQESLANAFAGFGPGGALVGILAAAGVGALITGIQGAQEDTDKLKEKFASLYQSATEESRTYLDAAQILGEVQSLIFDPERAGEYKKLQEEAARIGVDSSTYIRAIAGDEEAINVALEIGNAKRSDRQDWADKNLQAERDSGAVTDAQGAAMDAVLGKLDTRLTLTEDNKKAAELALQVEKDLDAAQEQGNKKAKDAVDERGKALQAYADKAASIPNPVLVPQVNTAEAERRMRELTSRRYEIEVGVRYPNGKPVLQ